MAWRKTVDDSGTGTNYRGMILYDLSGLELTCLSVLVHNKKVLELSSNGNELFGKSWSKN